MLNNPVNFVDPYGLYAEIGGGFGGTFGIYSVSTSVHTETCCDGCKLHMRTVSTTCWGMQLGFSIKLGGSRAGPGVASLSFGKKAGKCQYPKNDKEDVYRTDRNDFAISSGVGIFGASWSKKDPTVTTITAGHAGMSFHLYSECSHKILQDVVIGSCE